MTAAKALATIIRESDSESVVQIIDGLEYVNHHFNKFVVDGYKFSATKLPTIYGMMYRASNTDSKVIKLVTKANSHFAKKFIPLLAEFKPDVIVSTHPFTSIMCSKLIGKGVTNIPLITIMTDFTLHSAWINPFVSRYIVSSAQMVDQLEQMGVDRNIILPIGIPIMPVFFEKDEHKDEHLAQLGFDPNLKTVLIMAGSFGVTDILKIYENINEIDLDFQIIVITGKNEKLFDAFNTILSCNENLRVGELQANFDDDAEPSRKDYKLNITKKTKLIYYTDEVHKYMHLSDLIITKPGGLTVTEALASCLPMALFKGIPGQETENTEYLCSNNLAISIKKSNAAEVVYQLLKYPDRLLSMKESCTRLNNKDSEYKIVDVIQQCISEMKEPVLLPAFVDINVEIDKLEEETLYSEFNQVMQEMEDDFDIPDDDDDEFEEKIQRLKMKMYESLKKMTDFTSKHDDE